MKYIVILGDGMADYPVDYFDGKTILEAADKPTIDYMCRHGELGKNGSGRYEAGLGRCKPFGNGI